MKSHWDIYYSINWQRAEFEYLFESLRLEGHSYISLVGLSCDEYCEKINRQAKKTLLRDNFRAYATILDSPRSDPIYLYFDLDFMKLVISMNEFLYQQNNKLRTYRQELWQNPKYDHNISPKQTWANYLPRFNQVIDSLNYIIHYIDDLGYFDMEVEIINQSKFNKQLEAYCWAISGDILYKSFAQERLKALGIHRKSNREYMIWAEWYRKWVEEKRLFDFVKERKKMSIE